MPIGYVDVAEPAFGVAVLNDGRYGHALFDGAVRVSLARSARYPDPDPDKGRHEVTISLFPHRAGRAATWSPRPSVSTSRSGPSWAAGRR